MATILDILETEQKRALYARACQLARRYSEGQHDAGLDILHDAYVKALQVQGKYRGRLSSEAIGGWIYGIIGNLQMNLNSKQYGRNGRLGRKEMMIRYSKEQTHLYRLGGRRVMKCKPKEEKA